MVEERKKMELNGLSAPVLGVEERSDEVPSTGASSSRLAAPDPEVVARPKRRRFTAEYRLRIVEEADQCSEPGDIGRLLRREGLYSSHLTKWREARRDGALRGLRSKKRGAKAKAINPLAPKVRELEAKVARLEKDLHTAHTILDVQEKVAGLLGFSLEDGKDC
jgi:transposase-like protein